MLRSKLHVFRNPAIGPEKACVRFVIYKSQAAINKKTETTGDVFGCCVIRGSDIELTLLDNYVGSSTVAHEVLHTALEVYRVISGKQQCAIELVPSIDSEQHPEGHPEQCIYPEEQIAYLIEDITMAFWTWWYDQDNT